MAEFRENIPTISGPGTFLISLIFLALILTSEKSRNLAFDLEFAVTLVAISFPISIFLTQVYHALFMIFGYRKKDWGDQFIEYTKSMYMLDTMVDYLCHKVCKGDKEWVIIQKRAVAYNLFDMLHWTTILFLLVYTISLMHIDYGQIYHWGVFLIYGLVSSQA